MTNALIDELNRIIGTDAHSTRNFVSSQEHEHDRIRAFSLPGTTITKPGNLGENGKSFVHKGIDRYAQGEFSSPYTQDKIYNIINHFDQIDKDLLDSEDFNKLLEKIKTDGDFSDIQIAIFKQELLRAYRHRVITLMTLHPNPEHIQIDLPEAIHTQAYLKTLSQYRADLETGKPRNGEQIFNKVVKEQVNKLITDLQPVLKAIDDEEYLTFETTFRNFMNEENIHILQTIGSFAQEKMVAEFIKRQYFLLKLPYLIEHSESFKNTLLQSPKANEVLKRCLTKISEKGAYPKPKGLFKRLFGPKVPPTQTRHIELITELQGSLSV